MKSYRGSTLSALAGAAALALTVSGCSGSSSSGAGGNGDGPILTAYNGASGAFVKNFNPLSPTVRSGVKGMIYEPLFFFNNQAPLNTEPTPLLGQDYSFDKTGKVLKVTLRKGVKWSDGKPFTASDVAFTMNLIRATPSIDVSGNTPKAEATDATHVVLTFDRPSFTTGPQVLGQTYIVPEHTWKSVKNPATFVNAQPVGTGPLVMSSFSSQSYLMKKNPRFRGAGKLQVGGVRFTSLSGNESATNDVLANKLDWAGIFVPDVRKVLRNHKNVKFTLYGSQQIVLNTCSNPDLGCTGPQTDPVVRKAISAAINREQVNKLAYYGNAAAISPTFAIPGRDDAFIAPDQKGTLPMSAQVPKAEKLLTDDGWAKGSDGIFKKDGKRLSMDVLVTSGYTDYIATLQTLTSQLKKAGIEIDVRQVANQENNDAASLGKFQLQINGLFQGPAADPYYVYDKYFSSHTTAKVGKATSPYDNVSRFSDEQVDAALKEAAATDDNGKKAAAYAKIQKRIVDNLPYIPIINNKTFVLYNNQQVTGFPTDDDLYAQPAPNLEPDNGIVLQHLKVK